MHELEVRRKIVEEYVQHVYELKLGHQEELEKGELEYVRTVNNVIFSVEEIYKQKLLDIKQSRDIEIETIVRSARAEADSAVRNLRRSLQ